MVSVSRGGWYGRKRSPSGATPRDMSHPPRAPTGCGKLAAASRKAVWAST